MSNDTPLLSGTIPPVAKQGGSPMTALAFALNFIFGAGVLGLPYAFDSAGIVLSTAFMCLVTILAGVSMTWIVELYARAEVFAGMRLGGRVSVNLYHNVTDGIVTSHRISRSSVSEDIDTVPDTDVPIFAIGASPDFAHAPELEVNDMCEMFSGKPLRIAWDVCIIIYSYGGMWLYSAIFASSMTKAVPLYHFTESMQCDMQETHFNLPSECHTAYHIYLAIFAFFMIILSCREMSGQKGLQFTLTGLTLTGCFIMIATVIVSLFTHPSAWSTSTSAPYIVKPKSFDITGASVLVSSALFSQVCHMGVPGLVRLGGPDKHKMRWVFMGATSLTCLIYVLLGVLCSLYFGPGTEQMITLNWSSYHGTSNHGSVPWWAYAVRYFVVCFPMITVSAAFPLYAITMANNIESSLPNSIARRYGGKMVHYACRFFAAVPPLVGAFFVVHVKDILTYSGLVAFPLAFWIPPYLFLKARSRSMILWGPAAGKTAYHWHFSRPGYLYFVMIISSLFFIFSVYNLINPIK